jgi:large subunit ribosomal protein L7e
MNIPTSKRLSEKEIEERTLSVIKRMKSSKEKEKRVLEEAEKNSQLYVPKEPSLLIAVKIRSTLGASPKVKKILEILRLRKIHTGAFVLNNASNRGLLERAKSYIAYGHPSLSLVRELLYKKGLCRVDGSRKNITQETLQSKFDGTICTVEEMVEILFEGKEEASEVNRFLWPFTLNGPRGGYEKRKVLDYAEGGSSGNHQGLIDGLIRRMI